MGYSLSMIARALLLRLWFVVHSVKKGSAVAVIPATLQGVSFALSYLRPFSRRLTISSFLLVVRDSLYWHSAPHTGRGLKSVSRFGRGMICICLDTGVPGQ